MGQVKVVLKDKVANLGNEFDVVTVKRGYAVNFLLPEGLADFATPALIKKVEAEKARLEELRVVMEKEAEKIKELIDGKKISFKKKVSAKGHLYGSITEKDVADQLKQEFKIEVHADAIKMDKHIKEEGISKVEVELSNDVRVLIEVEIVKE